MEKSLILGVFTFCIDFPFCDFSTEIIRNFRLVRVCHQFSMDIWERCELMWNWRSLTSVYKGRIMPGIIRTESFSWKLSIDRWMCVIMRVMSTFWIVGIGAANQKSSILCLCQHTDIILTIDLEHHSRIIMNINHWIATTRISQRKNLSMPCWNLKAQRRIHVRFW